MARFPTTAADELRASQAEIKAQVERQLAAAAVWEEGFDALARTFLSHPLHHADLPTMLLLVRGTNPYRSGARVVR